MNAPYQQALRRFHDRSDYERGSITNPFGKDGSEGERGLARTAALLAELGNPHQAYPIVHIAGSKGKGSTCAFISTILTESGLKTGRYASPHLHSLRERIAIDGEAMTEADFAASLDRVIAASELVESAHPELGIISAFEISTAMAFEHFQREGCAIAVFEVGLGGTWDATNVVDPAVTGITLLDYEHTDVLGDTMAEIAANKSGIIKADRPVLSFMQPPEGMAVIEETATNLHAPLSIEGRDWQATGTWNAASFQLPDRAEIGPVKLGLTGAHQLRNAGLAAAIAATLADSAGFSDQITPQAILHGLAKTTLPARFEVIDVPGQPTIVVDGAHTGASAEALVDTLDAEFPDRPVSFLFGMLGGKNLLGMLQQLARRSDHLVVVKPQNPRALSEAAMIEAAAAAGLTAETAPDIAAGLARSIATTGPDGIVVITGSLGFAAEARQALGLAKTEQLSA